MANLNLDCAKTAVLSMDIQKATVRRSSMFMNATSDKRPNQCWREARHSAILVVHVVIDYQPAFFSPRNKFLQKIRIPVYPPPASM